MAHSLPSAPSLTSRVLGIAGIAAGLTMLAAFVMDLPSGIFRDRLLVFGLGVIAVGIGVHLRQSLRAPGASLAATMALAASVAFFLATVLFLDPSHVAVFWAGLALWLGSAAFGITSAVIGAVSRIGSSAVAIGSLLALTGMDRLGLVSESTPTIFNTLSQLGIAAMAIGWLVLGLHVAIRRVTPSTTG